MKQYLTFRIIKNLILVIIGSNILLFCNCQKKIINPNTSSLNLKLVRGGEADKLIHSNPTKDGGFIFSGTTKNDSSRTKGFLLKVDAFGNKQWYQQYGSEFIDEIHDAIECSDGGFIAVGKSSIQYSQSSSYFDLVIKTNSEGNVVWRKSFLKNSYLVSNLYSLVESDNHILHATGVSYSSDSFLTVLLKFNLNGDKISENSYIRRLSYQPNLPIYSNFTKGGDISFNKFNDVIIGAAVDKSGTLLSTPGFLSVSQNNQVNFFYPYSDINMSKIYHINLENNTGKDKAHSPLIVSVNDGYYLAIQTDSTVFNLTTNFIYLMKTDLQGNPLWKIKYELGGNLILNAFKIGPDGNLYIIGGHSSFQTSNYFPELFYGIKPMILKINTNGEIINKLIDGSESNTCMLNNIQFLSNQTILLSGYTCLNSSGFDQMFTIRTDNNLKIIQ